MDRGIWEFDAPFCPRPACPHHRDPKGFRYRPHGFFCRQKPPWVVARFKCLTCGRTFSTQTFKTTYWLKRPELQVPLFEARMSCAALRQFARTAGVSASTAQRQVSRLGRHCMLFQHQQARRLVPQEPVAIDGFMTFEYSQYWPFEINLLVGATSDFVYAYTDSELRRSGRMTAAQKRRRQELEDTFGKPDPHATRKAIVKLVRQAAPEPCTLDAVTDEHRAYPRAFGELPHAIAHRTVSSRRCRTTPHNPLKAVDLLDLLLRHCNANHKRETIAFSKRRQGAQEQMALAQVWRNFMKKRNENDPASLTPAQLLGLTPRRLTVPDVLARRLFPSHFDLPPPLDDYYWRRVPTRQVPRGTRHELTYAA
jgi:transposase-like protein